MAVRAVPVTLNGKEWLLRCSLGAMAACEDRGESWTSLLAKLKGDQPSMRAAQTLIWAMLQDADEPPSLKEVGQWIDPQNFPDVLVAVGEALRLAFPPAKEGGGRPPRARGTGAPSSDSPTAPSRLVPTPSGA